MKRDEYRAALDSVELSEGFRQNTLERLARATGQCNEKETDVMKSKRSLRMTVITAVAAAAIVVSAAAAAILLSPGEVADRINDPTLAAAFESDGAVLMNQSVESEGYTFTLAGIVSGVAISDYAPDVDTSRSYIVASMARTDGSPVADQAVLDTMFSPLVSGYLPWEVNAWTLGGARSTFTQDGVAYCLFDCQDLEIFADHTVYLAAFQGTSPSADTFAMGEDGAISFTQGVQGPCALFTIPLDSSRADPAAAARLLESMGVRS